MIILVAAGCGSTKTEPAPARTDRGAPPVVATPAPASAASSDAAVTDDADHDFIPDRCDACPNEPEIYNGDSDLDGCPDREVLYIAQPFGPFGIPFKRYTTVPEKDAGPTVDAIMAALANHWESGVEIVACGESDEAEGLIAKRQQWLRDILIKRGAVPSFLFLIEEPCPKNDDKDTHQRWVRARPHPGKSTGGCPDRSVARVGPPPPPLRPAPTPAQDRVFKPKDGKCAPGLCMLDSKSCVKVGYHSGTGGTGPCSGCDHGHCDATKCAAPTTPIDTPTGPRAISELRVGDLVWSTDDRGRRVVAALARVISIPVTHHHVVHIVLDDGSELLLSPQHPTASGTPVGDLQAGDALPPRRIVRVEVVPYPFGATYDILPATASGTYFSDGVALGSTLTSN